MAKKRTIALTVGAAGVAAWAASKAVVKPVPREPQTALSFSEPIVLANHGGTAEAPEQTMSAFKKAASLGVHGFTVSIRLTKDEEIIAFHDEFADRTTDFSGKISDYTWEELKKADAGYTFMDENGDYPYRGKSERILTLQEILEAFPQLLFIIEIKDSPDTYEGSLMPSKLWRVLEKMGAEGRVVVTSHFDEQTDRFNLYAQSKIAIGAGNDEVKKAYTAFSSKFGHLYKPRADLFAIRERIGIFPLASEHFIDYLKRLNVSVLYENVESPSQMMKLLKAGAAGFIADHPAKALEVVQNNT